MHFYTSSPLLGTIGLQARHLLCGTHHFYTLHTSSGVEWELVCGKRYEEVLHLHRPAANQLFTNCICWVRQEKFPYSICCWTRPRSFYIFLCLLGTSGLQLHTVSVELGLTCGKCSISFYIFIGLLEASRLRTASGVEWRLTYGNKHITILHSFGVNQWAYIHSPCCVPRCVVRGLVPIHSTLHACRTPASTSAPFEASLSSISPLTHPLSLETSVHMYVCTLRYD